MNTQNLLLILLVVAVIFGLGVVVLNRRSSGGAGVKPVTSKPVTSTPVIEKVETAVVETPVVEAPAPPKSRWGKTALSLAGVFGGVRARGGITNETWDDLEEALLKADVGIGDGAIGLRRREHPRGNDKRGGAVASMGAGGEK